MDTASTVRVNGRRLRAYRKDAFVERQELADAIGISPQRVSAIETGRKPNMRLGNFRIMCAALKLTDEQRRDLVAQEAA